MTKNINTILFLFLFTMLGCFSARYKTTDSNVIDSDFEFQNEIRFKCKNVTNSWDIKDKDKTNFKNFNIVISLKSIEKKLIENYPNKFVSKNNVGIPFEIAQDFQSFPHLFR